MEIISLLIILSAGHVIAENITYKDDIYMEQARPELVSLIDQVAQDIDFAGDYEAVEAKKAGLLINPWNQVIASGVNSQTKENFIVINHDWFKNLSKDEQKFLIARVLVKFEKGSQPFIFKVIVHDWITHSILHVFVFSLPQFVLLAV